MLETIITKVFWGVCFHEDSRFTGQPGKGQAISLTPHVGQTFWTKNLWGGCLNGRTNDHRMPRWGEELPKW